MGKPGVRPLVPVCSAPADLWRCCPPLAWPTSAAASKPCTTAPPLADVAALTKVRIALGRLACVTCSVDGTHSRVLAGSAAPQASSCDFRFGYDCREAKER
jgi:hypothetical protein